MFIGIANKVGPYLSAVLLRSSGKHDSLRLCGNILSVLGLVLILTAVFAISSKDFPGYRALLPVMGAVLMIAAGKDAFCNRYLLSNRVMVWFGLISYPLYIWHWPFLSFAWIVGGEMPQLEVRIGCVVLAVIMSDVTYYFVEPRLRWGRYGGYKAAGLLSAMILVGLAGYSIERHDGYTARMNNPEQPVIDAINKRMNEDNQRCLMEFPDWKKISFHEYYTQCHFQRPSGKNTIAVVGDSHAGHLYPGLITQGGEDDGIAMFASQCAVPLIGIQAGGSFWGPTEHLLSEGFSYILRHRNIKKVVLSSSPGCSYNSVSDTQNPDNHDFDSIMRDGFARTYEALANAGKEVYVVDMTSPDFDEKMWSKCQSSVIRRPISIPSVLSSKNTEICALNTPDLVQRQMVDYWNKVAHEAAVGYTNVYFLNLQNVFCPAGRCSMLDDDGDLIYMDRGHLNVKGSIKAATFIFDKLRQ